MAGVLGPRLFFPPSIWASNRLNPCYGNRQLVYVRTFMRAEVFDYTFKRIRKAPLCATALGTWRTAPVASAGVDVVCPSSPDPTKYVSNEQHKAMETVVPRPRQRRSTQMPEIRTPKRALMTVLYSTTISTIVLCKDSYHGFSICAI